jgi:uncharacterized protein involved in exopolysaccharide biosynthesis/Mrp family chromosome partitioning ATPase
LGLTAADLLDALRRQWALILVLGLTFAVVAYVSAAKLLPKKYTADAQIELEMRNFAVPELQGALTGDGLPDPMPLVRTETQVLGSRALVAQVVDEMHLIDDPEFNASLRPPSLMARLHDVLSHALSVFGPEVGPDTPAPSEAVATRDGVIGAVSHNLGIGNDNRSLIIDLQFTAEDPRLAGTFLNTLIRHYLDSKSQARDAADAAANSTLSRRVNQVRDEIAALEARIADTRQKYNLVQTRAGSVGQQQLEDLSSALTRATADRTKLEADFAGAQAIAQAGGIAQDSSEIVDSGTIGLLRDREATAARRVAELSVTLGPGHPLMRAAQAQLASSRAALAAEARRATASLGAQAAAARQRETDLRQQLSQAEGAVGSVAGIQSELQQLERDADARRAVYQTLLQGEMQTAKDSSATAQTGARVVSPATQPINPSSPHPKVAGAYGLVGGFAMGGLLALVLPRRQTFRLAEEISAATGLNTLAVVPGRRGGSDAQMAASVVRRPAGNEAEALRSLRLRMRFFGSGAAPRSVLVASSLPGEGGPGVAAAFARVAALDGVRVLLIEGDLQKPALATALGIPTQDGLAAALEGREHWRDLLARDAATPLHLLLASRPHAAAAQLLESMQFQNLIAEAREDYNLVVIAGQPVTAVTHAVVLANAVDAVVLVVEAGRTSRQAVRQAADTMTAASRRRPVVALTQAA